MEKKNVVVELRRLQTAGKKTTGMAVGRSSTLYCSAVKHFGSWDKALLASGVTLNYRWNWSKEMVFAACMLHGLSSTRFDDINELSQKKKGDFPSTRIIYKLFGDLETFKKELEIYKNNIRANPV